MVPGNKPGTLPWVGLFSRLFSFADDHGASFPCQPPASTLNPLRHRQCKETAVQERDGLVLWPCEPGNWSKADLGQVLTHSSMF